MACNTSFTLLVLTKNRAITVLTLKLVLLNHPKLERIFTACYVEQILGQHVSVIFVQVKRLVFSSDCLVEPKWDGVIYSSGADSSEVSVYASERNVIEYRSSVTLGMLCCHSCRAGPVK